MKVVDYDGMTMVGFAVFEHVRMVARQVVMRVTHVFFFFGGPEQKRNYQTKCSYSSHDDKSCVEPEACAEPSCQRIGYQPAGMAQCKLRSEYGRPVFRLSGSS